MAQALAHLLEDTALSDVTFMVDNRRFSAHRCVLAARSQFFRGLLTSGMQEGVTGGDIVMQDVSATGKSPET
jgi:hypothetical protein